MTWEPLALEDIGKAALVWRGMHEREGIQVTETDIAKAFGMSVEYVKKAIAAYRKTVE